LSVRPARVSPRASPPGSARFGSLADPGGEARGDTRAGRTDNERARYRVLRACADLEESGADGDRTRDLCHAMAALSQLSYGPFAGQCSLEFVLRCPVDAKVLAVVGRSQPQRDVAP